MKKILTILSLLSFPFTVSATESLIQNSQYCSPKGSVMLVSSSKTNPKAIAITMQKNGNRYDLTGESLSATIHSEAEKQMMRDALIEKNILQNGDSVETMESQGFMARGTVEGLMSLTQMKSASGVNISILRAGKTSIFGGTSQLCQPK